MQDLGQSMTNIVSQFPRPSVLVNFLSNHDVPRFRAVTASDSVAFNAFVWQFMFDGVPVTYYGEEQEIAAGLSDPDQRQALWESGMGDYSTDTNTYKRMQKLNALRKFLMSDKVKIADGALSYLEDKSKVVLSSTTDLAFTKGPILVVLNNVSCWLPHDAGFKLKRSLHLLQQRVSLDSSVTVTIPPSVSSSGIAGELYEYVSQYATS